MIIFRGIIKALKEKRGIRKEKRRLRGIKASRFLRRITKLNNKRTHSQIL